jgi:hypothetical protein
MFRIKHTQNYALSTLKIKHTSEYINLALNNLHNHGC